MESMSYVNFMLCLALGLLGLCMVLKTLLESLVADWDIVKEWRDIFRRPRHKSAVHYSNFQDSQRETSLTKR